MPSNIILIGFMGTGKTVVGMRLAEILQMQYIDTDDTVEADSGMIISTILSEMGEYHFRNLESKAVEKACKLNRYVVSTGGGAVLRDQNIQNLKSSGMLFCLDATPEEIFQRTSKETHRPLLQVEEPIGRIRELLEVRKSLYGKADHRINTTELTVEQVADKIIKLFEPHLHKEGQSSC